jgi:CO/xanthine dehydrogenase FAD-binding subunit
MPSVTRPASVAAAMHAGRPANVFIAGGTALQLAWIDTPPPAALVDLSGLPDWRTIEVTAGSLRIGAGATLEQCRTNPAVGQHAPLLQQACEVIGAYAIRNLGTLGGNIGWRQGDTLPALLASQAEIELGDGSRPPLDSLLKQHAFATPLPLIVAVHLPLHAVRPAVFFEKVGHRAAFTPTVVAACAMLATDGHGLIRHAQLAVSGAGVAACRLPDAEAVLAGRDTRGRDWHMDFETVLLRSLARLPGIQAHQQRVLGRLLPGRLYQLCETS